MALDEELKKLAKDFAEDIFNRIYVASQDVSQKIDGEALIIYQELKDWGWFSEVSIDDPRAHELYTRVIAMTKYRHLKWKKAHRPKPKPSKWEVVTGRRLSKPE